MGFACGVSAAPACRERRVRFCRQLLWLPFFAILEFCPPLNPPTAHQPPTSPPKIDRLKLQIGGFFKASKNVFPKSPIFFGLGALWVVFCLPQRHQNRTKVGKKRIKNRSWISAPFFDGFMTAEVSKMEPSNLIFH